MIHNQQVHLFLNRTADNVHNMIVTSENWGSDPILEGDYAMIAHGKKGEPVGYVSFNLLTTGDAYIIQVQGRKGSWFPPERRNALVQNTRQFLNNIHANRVFLVTGEILNATRKET